MFKIVREQVRPNTEVDFFNFATGVSDEAKRYYHEHFKVNGLHISSDISLSEDSLTATSIQVWKDRDSFLSFLCDSYMYETILTLIGKYNKDNNITSNVVSMEEY